MRNVASCPTAFQKPSIQFFLYPWPSLLQAKHPFFLPPHAPPPKPVVKMTTSTRFYRQKTAKHLAQESKRFQQQCATTGMAALREPCHNLKSPSPASPVSMK